MSSYDYAGRVYRGAWLVYINGLEVPCISVVVNFGVGTIPTASIAFPPHRLLHRLGAEDRLDVVIFYLDEFVNPQKPEFRLLFEGELMGWSYVTVANQRQISFDAIADISVFTQLFFFFLNNVDTVASFVAQKSDVAGVYTAGAVYPFSLFKKGLLFTQGPTLDNPPPTDITRPFEIIYNAVRGMLDSGIDPKLRAIPSVNFFSRWARKRNFVNRFAALPLFEDGAGDPKVFPIIQAAQATTAMEAMQTGVAQAIGNAGTLWSVLQEVYSHVLFEIVMLPTAPCARVRLSDGTILRPGVVQPPEPLEMQRLLKLKGEYVDNKVLPTEPIRLINYFVKPQMFFGIAPSCNMMFPCMTNHLTYAESYIAQPTRTYVNDQFIAGVLPQNVATTAALTFGFPPEVGAVLKAKMGDATHPRPSNISKSGKNMLVFPEEFFKGPVVHRMPVPAWFTYLQNNAPPTSSTASTQPAAENVDEAKSLGALMSGYVEYEHYRARYEKRGGAVDMAWNPYVVPGFPCVVFDQKASAFHTVGYLNSVQHTLSQSGMSTAINYTMSRTLPEMLELLRDALAKNPGKVFGCAPLEPLTPVRDIIQDFTQAEQFYNALFFLREAMPQGKKASFDFREVIGYTNADGTTDAISTTNLVGNRAIAPLPGFVPVFNQYDTAMQYVARPICTLTDYISFIHGGMPLDLLREPNTDAKGVQYGAQVEDGDDKFGEVTYFKRITRFIQGPGETPAAPVLGVSGSGEDAVEYTGVNQGTTNPSQTRADWDTVLEAYRAEMYSRQSPQE